MFWDARFLNPFFESLPADCCKKRFKKRASQQMFVPSYFDRALVLRKILSNMNVLTSRFMISNSQIYYTGTDF